MQEDDLGFEDQQAIHTDWEVLLGRRLTYEETFPRHSLTNPDISLGSLDLTGSNGPRLLKILIGATARNYPHMYAHRDDATEMSHCILECNHRSVFNFLVGYFLELPYIPSVARVPFHRFFYDRAKVVQHHLASINKIENEHRRMVELYFRPDSSNVTLPFLLAVVLTQINSLSEFFEKLTEVREQAEPLRKRRAEFDEALYAGDVRAAAQLRSAFQREAENLCDRYPYAPIAGGSQPFWRRSTQRHLH